jgi:hypothetical protein
MTRGAAVRTAGHRSGHGPVSPRARVISWVRQHLILATALPVVLAAVAVGAIVLSTGSGRDGPATPAVTAAPVQSPATGGAKWLAGSASQLLTTVNTDLARLTRAERGGRGSAATRAGAQLAADAKAALAGPMPPDRARAYRSALSDLELVGDRAADGKFSPASRLLAAGTAGLTTVTAAADVAAPVNPPAPVTDPNG